MKSQAKVEPLKLSMDERDHLLSLANALDMRFFSPPGDPELFGDVIRAAKQYVHISEGKIKGDTTLGGLTKRQREIFLWIRQFISIHGHSPSIREIMSGCEFQSTGRAHDAVIRLVDRGFLTYTPGKSRSIKLVTRT